MRPGGGAADAKRPFVTARKASLSPWTGCGKMENRVKTKKSPRHQSTVVDFLICRNKQETPEHYVCQKLSMEHEGHEISSMRHLPNPTLCKRLMFAGNLRLTRSAAWLGTSTNTRVVGQQKSRTLRWRSTSKCLHVRG